MRKMIALCLVMFFCCTSSLSPAFADEPQAVQVVVNVADGIFTINDEIPQLAYLPYLSETGVTMAQMDVITDAFGAQVAQDGDAITITYAGVEMKFFIGNTNAFIGENEVMMPELPVRVDGYIMMPLRFLCECFGADVTVDPETGNISISSINLADGTEVDFRMLLKYGAKERIGNSKEKWSFKTPKDFDVQTSYWGNYNTFYANDISFDLTAMKNKDKMNIDELFLMLTAGKNDSYYYGPKSVLMEKTKGTKLGHSYICLRERMPEQIRECHAFLVSDYFYIIEANVPYKDLPEYKSNTTMSDILNSLRFDFTGEDDNTVDLAKKVTKIKPGEQYTDGNFMWSITPSEGWEVEDYYGFYNKVNITCPTNIEEDEDEEDDYNYYNSYSSYSYYRRTTYKMVNDPTLTVAAYSKTKSLSEWIQDDIAYFKSGYNPEYIKVSGPSDIQIGDLTGKSVDFEVKFEKYLICIKTYYLEDANYRYQLTLNYDKRETETEGFLDSMAQMMKSFTPGETNKDLIGDVLTYDNNLVTDKVKKEYKLDFMTLTAPYLWSVRENGNYVTVYSSGDYRYGFSGSGITITRGYLDEVDDEGNVKYKSFDNIAKESIVTIKKMFPRAIEVTEPITKTTFGGRNAYTYSIKEGKISNTIIHAIFVEGKNNDYFEIAVPEMDLYIGTWTYQVMDEILKSITFTDSEESAEKK